MDEGASPKHHVKVVSVHDYKVNPCIGCNSCFAREDRKCCQKDDMQYKLCLNFFKLQDMGQVLVRGAKDKGDVKNGDSLQKAFELGQSL